MDTPTMAIKSKPLSISEMLNVINRGDGVQNVPYTPNDEEYVIPVKNIHDKVFGESDTGENVLRLLQTAKIKHTCTTSSQKV
jgi:hypothetical protein